MDARGVIDKVLRLVCFVVAHAPPVRVTLLVGEGAVVQLNVAGLAEGRWFTLRSRAWLVKYPHTGGGGS
jgi:hypothetical protein